MKKALCATLIATMSLLPMQAARAGMIGVLQGPLPSENQARLEIVQELQALGVPRAAAEERVAALSDEEAGRLAAQTASAPAGGNAVFLLIAIMAVLVFIFNRSLHSK